MKKTEDQKIVIVRHAHRHKLHPEEDNGLSEKGQHQVENLIVEYRKGHLPEGRVFWSSPKRRCIETLEPLAQTADASIEIESLLDEQSSHESSKDFQKRVEKLVKKAEVLEQTVYLCSHGDLIPEAIEAMTGRSVDLEKGQAVVLSKDNDRWRLE